MEATTLLITLPLILFLSFTTNGVSARHGFSIVDQHRAVLDVEGNKVLKDEYYYLQPARLLRPAFTLPPIFSAIIPGVYSTDTCWFRVALETAAYPIGGLPAKFLPVAPSNDSWIHESTDVIIEFPDKLGEACGGSSVLKANRFLYLGGSADGTSYFKFEKLVEPRHIYKLVYSYGKVVGTSTRPDKTERLALTDDEPLQFELVPV